MARERTIGYGSTTGTRIRRFTGGVETRVFTNGQSKSIDFVGFPADHPLEILQVSCVHPLLSGIQGSMLSGYIYNAYPLGPFGSTLPNHVGASSVEPSDVFSATKVAGDTNPSQPVVSVPLFLFELIRELPNMLLDAGETFLLPDRRPKRSTRDNFFPQNDSVAAFNFGWEQLFRDVASLINFSAHADQRFKELNALYDKGGLKRSRNVWTDTSPLLVDNSYTLNSQGGTVRAVYNVQTKRRKWVSCRWRPINRYNIPSAEEQVQKARALVHGWRIDPSDIWNALPWSWLVDYFSNVGDLLAASSNTAGNRLESCCIMYQLSTKENMFVFDMPPGTSCTNGSRTSESKYRRLGTIGLTADVPLISGRRLLNLLSIANGYGYGKDNPYHG